MGRIGKNMKLRKPENRRIIKGFRLGRHRLATTILGQPRYDRFDMSPYTFFNTCLLYQQPR